MLTILRPLGAWPIIAKIGLSIVSWMVKGRLTAYAAAKQAAAEYEIFQTLKEAQISELALELASKTELPDWQWFNILRRAQEFGLVDPEPEPIPPPEEEEKKTPIWVWAIVAGVGVLLLLNIR